MSTEPFGTGWTHVVAGGGSSLFSYDQATGKAATGVISKGKYVNTGAYYD